MSTTRVRISRTGPLKPALLILLLTTILGCSLALPQPGTQWSGPRSYGSSSDRTSFYDRYREEQHRRKVEKELRDIKRNTQRTKGDKLR